MPDLNDDWPCKIKKFHAVTLIGFDLDLKMGKQRAIGLKLKNSFGENWGHQGQTYYVVKLGEKEFTDNVILSFTTTVDVSLRKNQPDFSSTWVPELIADVIIKCAEFLLF